MDIRNPQAPNDHLSCLIFSLWRTSDSWLKHIGECCQRFNERLKPLEVKHLFLLKWSFIPLHTSVSTCVNSFSSARLWQKRKKKWSWRSANWQDYDRKRRPPASLRALILFHLMKATWKLFVCLFILIYLHPTSLFHERPSCFRSAGWCWSNPIKVWIVQSTGKQHVRDPQTHKAPPHTHTPSPPLPSLVNRAHAGCQLELSFSELQLSTGTEAALVSAACFNRRSCSCWF